MAENLGAIYAELGLRLNNVSRQVDSFRSMLEDASSATSDTQDSISNSTSLLSANVKKNMLAAGGALTGFGLAVSGVLAGAVSKYAEHEDAMKRFSVQTNITGKELEDFEKRIKNTYADAYGESIADVAEQFSKFQRVLGTTADETEFMTKGAYTLADVFKIEMNDTLKASDSLMKNFQLSGIEALDIITKGMQLAGDKSDDFLDTLDEYAPQFAKLGFKSDEMLNILIKGMQEGAFNTDQLADAIKEMGIVMLESANEGTGAFKTLLGSQKEANKLVKGLRDGSISTADAMRKLNSGLANIDDNVKQNALGVEIYGTLWEELGGKVILNMTNAADSVGELNGTFDKVNKKMSGGFSKEWDRFKRQLEEIVKIAGKALSPTLKSLTDYLIKMTKWLQNLSETNPELVQMAAKVGLVVAAISTVVGIILTAASIIGKFIGVIAGLKGAAAAVASTIGAIAAALGLPVIAVVAIVAAIAAAVALIIIYWDEIKAFTISAWGAIVDFFKMVWGYIVDYFNKGVENSKKVIQWFLDLPGKIAELFGKIPGLLKSIWDRVTSFFLETLPYLIGFIIGRFIRLVIEAPAKMQELRQKILNIMIDLVFKAVLKIQELYSRFIYWVGQLPGRLEYFFNQMKTRAINAVSKLLTYMLTAASTAYSRGKNFGQKIEDGIKSILKNLPTLIGKMIDKAIATLTNAGSAAYNKARNFASNMWNGFKAGLGIHSPSYIEKAMFNIEDQSDRLARSLKKDFTGLSRMPELNTYRTIAKGVKESSTRTPIDQAQQVQNNSFQNLLNIGNLSIRSDDDLRRLEQLSQQMYERNYLILRANGIK